MVGKLPTRFEVIADDVEGRYSVVRQVVPPGVMMTPHTHTVEDQVAIVITGVLGVKVGDREWSAGVGEVVVRPRGLVHSIWNSTDTDVEILEITSPGRFEEYFADLGDLTAEGRLSEAPELARLWGITQEPELVETLAARYGVSP
jgi:mannose-6-phosphate isomerase-like protein (cupin superfamily)